MKHWIIDRNDHGRGERGLMLKENKYILTIFPEQSGIVIQEECDSHFREEYTYKEALELIDELKKQVEEWQTSLTT